MKRQDCRFHGKHHNKLIVIEECRDCGHQRYRGPTSRFALAAVPVALWANALLMLALLVG